MAFIISEVIQGEGGLNIASKKFILNLRKKARQYDVPLIIDEVQSGMGRTGTWWAYQHYGIEPDIMTVAKGLQVERLFMTDCLIQISQECFQALGELETELIWQ